jgi:hypothetical protein
MTSEDVRDQDGDELRGPVVSEPAAGYPMYVGHGLVRRDLPSPLTPSIMGGIE